MEKELRKISKSNGAFYAQMAILANSRGKLLTVDEHGEPVLRDIEPEKDNSGN